MDMQRYEDQQKETAHRKVWAQVQGQVYAGLPQATVPLWRSSGIRAAVLFILVAAAAIYGVYRYFATPESEPMPQLVTPLEMQQTIDGIRVKLNWAYADNSQIALGYQIFNENENRAVALPQLRLTDDAGHIFWPDGNASNVSWYDGNLMDANARFLMPQLDPPQAMNLRLELVAGISDPANALADFDVKTGSGGGGSLLNINESCDGVFGRPKVSYVDALTGELTRSDANQQADWAARGIEGTGPFVFEFTVPFTTTAITLTADQVRQANQMGITLETVHITPSMVQVVLRGHQSLQDTPPLLDATPVLRMGQVEREAESINLMMADDAFCMTLDFVVPDGVEQEPWALTMEPEEGEPWVFTFDARGLTH